MVECRLKVHNLEFFLEEELVKKRIEKMWPWMEQPHESLMRKMKKGFELQNDKKNEGTPNSQLSFMF